MFMINDNQFSSPTGFRCFALPDWGRGCIDTVSNSSDDANIVSIVNEVIDIVGVPTSQRSFAVH